MLTYSQISLGFLLLIAASIASGILITKQLILSPSFFERQKKRIEKKRLMIKIKRAENKKKTRFKKNDA